MPRRDTSTDRAQACIALLIAVIMLTGCDGRIYTRDGITDGDTFYVPVDAAVDQDPVVQSWIAYGLSRSTCKLSLGGDNPARNSSYACELSARELLVESWLERRGERIDADLDTLARVWEHNLLGEYVWHYLRRRDWERPPGLEMKRFAEFRARRLRHHVPVTRIIGSWNYANP